MKRKSILFFLALVPAAVVVLYFGNIYGWRRFRRNTDTPDMFLNLTVVNSKYYTKDSLEVVWQLKRLLFNREGFFHNTSYSDSTVLIIDTIVYSPDLNKLAFFVIAKNPTSRQLAPDYKHDWFYDATCYLGIRSSDTVSVRLVGPVFTNSPDLKDISNDIRESCFRTFVVKDKAGKYAYNMNDRRFWTGPIWEELENKGSK